MARMDRVAGLGPLWRIVAIVVAALAIAAAPASAKVGTNPCPNRADYKPYTDQELSAARSGYFSVAGQPPVRLVPRVNWKQNPYNSETWQSKLHATVFFGPLFTLYKRDGDVRALGQARDLMLDWIRGNPPYGSFGWADKITGNRAARLAYLTAAADCAGILTRKQYDTLIDSAMAHGKYLADPDNYNPGNHGLFEDLGLMALTRTLPSLPKARTWSQLAHQRFRKRIPIHPVEGVDLEHSPGYHFLVMRVVQSALADDGESDDPELTAILAKMRAVAPWFVMPDGILTRLGDTAVKHPDDFTPEQLQAYAGIAPTTRSGFGIVRQPALGAYLSVADGYHPYGHKQADELTFELYDAGRHIVTDTGRYGALRDREDPAKVRQFEFTLSSQAHSGLVVDGKSYPFEKSKPYGSAIVGTGAGDGWYAIEGTNPLLAAQNVRHDRLFLYKPGQALVVVDRVNARDRHLYTRYFQFDPGIAVRRDADGRTIDLGAEGFSGALFSAPATGEGATRIVTGQRDPLLGFTTSENAFAPFIARPAVVYQSRAKTARFASVISLNGPATVSLQASSDTGVVVRLTLGGQRIDVTALRSQGRIAISEAPAPASSDPSRNGDQRGPSDDPDEANTGSSPSSGDATSPPAGDGSPPGDETSPPDESTPVPGEETSPTGEDPPPP